MENRKSASPGAILVYAPKRKLGHATTRIQTAQRTLGNLRLRKARGRAKMVNAQAPLNHGAAKAKTVAKARQLHVARQLLIPNCSAKTSSKENAVKAKHALTTTTVYAPSTRKVFATKVINVSFHIMIHLLSLQSLPNKFSLVPGQLPQKQRKRRRKRKNEACQNTKKSFGEGDWFLTSRTCPRPTVKGCLAGTTRVLRSRLALHLQT